MNRYQWSYHAETRGLVRLDDGRTARLVVWPKSGSRARVQLPSGAFLGVRTDRLTAVDPVKKVAR